jgi:hypothetical protein
MTGYDYSPMSTFDRAIKGLTFHPDDVETFGAFECAELFTEILVGEFGWNQDGPLSYSYGDSGVQYTWAIAISPLRQIDVLEFEGSAGEVARTSFNGEWRRIAPRALAFLASNFTSSTPVEVVASSTRPAPMF